MKDELVGEIVWLELGGKGNTCGIVLGTNVCGEDDLIQILNFKMMSRETKAYWPDRDTFQDQVLT